MVLIGHIKVSTVFIAFFSKGTQKAFNEMIQLIYMYYFYVYVMAENKIFYGAWPQGS